MLGTAVVVDIGRGQRWTMQREGRSCRGNREREMTKSSEARGRGERQNSEVEKGGEWRWDAAFFLVSCLPLSLFCGRSSGYQIFAAPLANNASLDKPESLFTIAGYSFVAFFLGS